MMMTPRYDQREEDHYIRARLVNLKNPTAQVVVWFVLCVPLVTMLAQGYFKEMTGDPNAYLWSVAAMAYVGIAPIVWFVVTWIKDEFF